MEFLKVSIGCATHRVWVPGTLNSHFWVVGSSSSSLPNNVSPYGVRFPVFIVHAYYGFSSYDVIH